MRFIAIGCFIAGCSGSSPGHGSDGGAPPSDAGAHAGYYVNATFTNGQGARDYRAYIPSGYVSGVATPLVVFLHGCTESLDHAEAATRLTALAEARSFVVVYPAQSTAANPAGCWNWFLAADQARDQGEPSLIAGITRTIMSGWSIDPKRVYVIGPSAGGCMSVVMGATYPDVFAAIGVVAGCEYAGQPCGVTGGPDPKLQGQSAYSAMGTRARVVPVIGFHGDADTVAAPVNGQQVIDQWIATDDYADDGMLDGSVPATPTLHETAQVPGGETYDHDRYAAIIERYLIHGMGHAWPGGTNGLTFTDPNGPDATTIAYEFFAAHAMP
jgi:poly(hydroxyalkanoate) depolymerase family esterase